jgi:hypothetical protein
VIDFQLIVSSFHIYGRPVPIGYGTGGSHKHVSAFKLHDGYGCGGINASHSALYVNPTPA